MTKKPAGKTTKKKKGVRGKSPTGKKHSHRNSEKTNEQMIQELDEVLENASMNGNGEDDSNGEETERKFFDPSGPDSSLKSFLKDISQIPLLTQEEEKQLAKTITSAKTALAEVEALYGLPVEGLRQLTNGRKIKLKKAEFTRLQEKVIQAEYEMDEARKRLIESNLRLVISIAKRYQNKGLPLLDLINEGNLGLLRAVDMFDYKRGFRFSTYATYWIRQAVVRALASQGRTIRLPVHLVDQLNRFARTKQELIQKNEREPSIKEIAAELDVSEAKAELWEMMLQESTSLETPLFESSNIQLADFIADNTTLSPYSVVEEDMVKEYVHSRLLNILRGREKEVVELRYGLGDEPPMTLEQIGKKLGVTRERVRQIEKQAIQRMRFYRSREEIEHYLHD